MAALALGAEGIEMGTRFIAVQECVDASPLYKNRLVSGTENDTVVIKRTIGAPARAIANSWTDKILEIEKENGGYEQLKAYISGQANTRYIHDGLEEEGFAWAGQVMGLIHDIPTTEELISRMINQAEGIRKKWAE